MNKIRLVCFLLCILLFHESLLAQSNANYGMSKIDQKPSLTTPWTESVSPKKVLPEYPRPQMVRSSWINLNGLWNYAITDSSLKRPANFDGTILVPYPIESTLSGVKKALSPGEKLWYQKTFENIQMRKDKRYLIHFGAVDYYCEITINGKIVGTHEGGYQEFSFDISDVINHGKNEILIAVIDPTDQGNNPRGKQTLNPRGMLYTASSGIWQTVWLEIVPKTYISELKIHTDVDAGFLSLAVDLNRRIGGADYKDYMLEISVFDSSSMISSVKSKASREIHLAIPHPKLWSPILPFLYDLKVKLYYKNKQIDEIKSYFGMRKIEVKKDKSGQERIFLNNQYTFNLGVLDQGFWPDGLYTAATDDALRWDIQTIKDMGFNTIRKHIKVEPSRWYYWCDKLGIMVWQDMPFPANLSTESRREFEKESHENISQLFNHPSIICWVLFNEGWNKYNQASLTKWIKKLDSCRLVNGHSGENYDRSSPESVAEKWIFSDMADIHVYPGPNVPSYFAGKARVLGEWGGIRVHTPMHDWDTTKGWGYIECNAQEFQKKYEFMMKHLQLFEQEGLSAAIYTQPFDVETEENGIITYDRKVYKIPVEEMKKINDIMFKK